MEDHYRVLALFSRIKSRPDQDFMFSFRSVSKLLEKENINVKEKKKLLVF